MTIFAPTDTAAARQLGFRLKLNEDVFWIDAPDGTLRLLDLRRRFYALTRTAGERLRLTLEHGIDRAAVMLAERYATDVGRMRAELDRLLSELERQRLIVGGDSFPSREKRVPPLTGCLAPIVRTFHQLIPSLLLKAWILLAVARLSFAVLGWTRTVGLWMRLHPVGGCGLSETGGECIVNQIDRAVHAAAARHLLRVNCKERALCCWSLLRMAGCPNRLVMGINLTPLLGHAWCEVNERIVSDDAAHCTRFSPVAVYE